MHIKFKGLDRLYQETKEELDHVVNDVYKSGLVVNSKYCRLVEEQLKSLTGRKHAKMMASGTAGLMVSLLALGLKGKSIAVSNYSYIASANQAALISDNVEFIDVDRSGIMQLPNEINHDGIMPVSLYGNTPDYDTLIDRTPITKIICDCAQSLGAKYKGQYDGAWGDVAVFSFSGNKPIPCAGTQGAIVWDDDRLTKRINAVANNGKGGRYVEPTNYGINAEPFEIQSAQIYINMKKLDKWQNKRTEIAEYYMEALKDLPIKFIEPIKDCTPNYHKFVVLTEKRNELFDYLTENQIETAKYYTDNLNKFFGLDAQRLMPGTEHMIRTNLSLPNHAWLTDAEVETVVNKIKKFYA